MFPPPGPRCQWFFDFVAPGTGNVMFQLRLVGTGTAGVLFYKTLVEFGAGTTRARPVVIGGAGLQPTLTPAKPE